MSVGKKLTVVMSVVVVGVSMALFFSKDVFWGGATDDPFGTHIERRVAGSATLPVERLPAATAAITQPELAQAPPAYHRSYRPVGTLLAPIDGVPVESEDDGESELPNATPAEHFMYGGATRHTVADGDTLSQLAVRYYGSAEAYWRIYEANRDVLTSPDLLPIGAVLEIPSRNGSPVASTSSASTSPASEAPLPMVPVPERPDGVR